MKTLSNYLLFASLFLTACSTTQTASNMRVDDDTYYSLADAKNTPPVYHEEIKYQDVSPANSSTYNENSTPSSGNSNFDYNQYKKENETESSTAPASNNPNYSTDGYVDDKGNTYITNNYYDDDDDYYYATRIQRFHEPYIGFGYYSPAYCGFYADPFYSGFSIGFGYTWGAGSFYLDPFYSSFYSPFYNPYAYYYNPYYNPYRWGYYNGYSDGYYGNGYWGGRNGYASANTTYINRPRPSRGGAPGTGGRTTPVTNTANTPANTNTDNGLRPSPLISSPTPANTGNANTGRTNTPPVRTTPVNNGYVAPALPITRPTTRDEKGNSPVIIRPERNTNTNTSPTPNQNYSEPIKVSPVKVDPRVRETRPVQNDNSSPSTPRVREPKESRDRSSYSSPSQQSSPRSESPSRSNSGSSSSPSQSRPRPR